MRIGRLASVLTALVLAAGCSTDAPPPADGDDPYAGFPPCEDAPAAGDHNQSVRGLVLPSGATVQSTSATGPLTTVTAYVEATPLDIRSELSSRDGVEVLHAEDEVFEAELLLAADGRRSLVKAVAVCDAASRIVAVVGPQGGEGLPSPGAGG